MWWLFCVFLLNQSHALPNFVFVLTDDQDLTLRSLDFLNQTVKLVANQGLTFTNFYVNSPICCPSRSTILTGGCSSVRWQQQYEKNTIASILKSRKNYTTFYAGKYLNQYGKSGKGVKHVPPGYDWWLGLKGNSKYYNYTLSINGSGHFFEKDYLTDKITKYALDFLNQTDEGNFFMMLAPPACHAPFTPADRHRRLFPDLETLKTPPFNATPSDKHWIVAMPPMSLPQNVQILDEIYKNRIRTLQSVDEMVQALITKLQEIRVLDNTYFIVTSDNGFHIGQFTQPWDKRQPYESDIRVPFMIRGPNIRKKTVSEVSVSAVDIFATILDLAEITSFESDGRSFKEILFKNQSFDNKYTFIEYWGEGNANSIDSTCPWGPTNQLSECVPEAWCKCQDSRNNTYTCVLDISSAKKIKFCLFEYGFVEAYDLIEDPHELVNLKLDEDQTTHYLNVLEKFKFCKKAQCQINI
ncbi:N-acetylglucosamine-6-sulfatase isoform X2 [Tribolium castaneum]|uniref:N-acetylglucosamine-6-sulfatase isoform X2 n=1 Tax=Tribolium castaneum TaxID=7070 RepID=UPI00077DC9E9|nr:PREDICTED: N-acetylglucosamine-6-sulfatase isoform X2 [Tribolium castaneum]|eukprot:XP_015836610.1 PREDICTED: N-acetylglucosamine-6-sulfatase isoform X2 [Tribolium castaneum]